MGYRSDVRIKLRETDYNVMVEKAPTEDIKNALEYSNILDKRNLTDSKNNTELFVLLEWNDVKWYDSYDDVAYIMNFIRDLPCYAFTIIGEEDGDIERTVREGDFDYYDMVIETKTQFIDWEV